jgi:glycosyltransferase involved in cell wall biosynthesis
MAPAGGVERVISSHIRHASQQHQTVLITKDNGQSFYDLPELIEHRSLVTTFVTSKQPRWYRVVKTMETIVRSVFRLSAILRTEHPDVIYTSNIVNLLEVFLTQWHLRNVWHTEHSSFQAYNTVYKFLAKRLYKKVRVLSVPTRTDVDLYRTLGIKSVYLPNPLPFQFKHTRQSTLTNSSVICVGRLTNDKRHDLLLHMWRDVANTFPNWKLHIFGDGENRSALLRLIEQLKLQSCVELHQPVKNIKNEYLKSSISVLSSRNEGFGMVLVEAMACGLPCVAFDCPSGPRDIVIDGINGFLVADGNKTQFVQRIMTLIINAKLRQQLGAGALESIQRFDELYNFPLIDKLVLSRFNSD